MKSILMLFVLYATTIGFLSAQEANKNELKVGDPAPDFSLPYATKDSVAEDSLRLLSLVGKKNIVLAFYPADWSGGCTKEMCTMRDNFTELSGLNAEILPISGDYQFAHHEWAKSQNFPFKMVSDHLHKIARVYNSYTEGYNWNKRTVYVIDKHGNIAYIDLAYKARDTNSFEKLKEALKNLQ
jgi:peroxiredoxin